MNKSIVLILLFLLIGLYSCENTQIPMDPLEHFKEYGTTKLSVSKRIDLDSVGIFKPGGIIKHGDMYVIEYQSDECMLKAWTPASNKLYKGIHKGNGPDDIISMSSMQFYKGDLLLYDIMRKRMKKLDLCEEDTTIKLSDAINLDIKRRPFIVALTDNGWLASGYFQSSWIHYYNNENRLISSLPFPSFLETEGLSDDAKSIIYMSTEIAVKPDGNKMVCATQKAGVVSISDCKPDTLIETVRLQYFPAVVQLNQTTTVTYSKEGKVGFCEVNCDNDFIYLLYSGRTRKDFGMKSHHCQHILVYDWNGKPIRHYELEVPLFTMGYDSERKMIYGIGYEPEGCIIEYELEEL